MKSFCKSGAVELERSTKTRPFWGGGGVGREEGEGEDLHVDDEQCGLAPWVCHGCRRERRRELEEDDDEMGWTVESLTNGLGPF